MKNGVNTLLTYARKVVDLSRHNRLLKLPKNAKSIIFDMNLTEFMRRFRNQEGFCIELLHHQILHQEQATHKVQKAYIPPMNLQGEKLIASLNALRLGAKRNYEEHGLHTLFLTIGRVKWKEPSVGSKHSGNIFAEYDYNAPLLLMPIRIEEQKSPKRTVISADLDVVNLNQVLNLLLEREYSASPLNFTQEDNENLTEAYRKLCLQVNKVFSELKLEFEIVHDIQIGQYSFLGQQIYQELTSNKDAIIEHEFINALCMHSQLEQKSLDIKIEHSDALLKKESDFNVMDADSSQLSVIHNVLNKSHLNIQGPPGTGKSQTIVNIVSNLLARKKTVLVVSEKQVALQVLLDRLKKTGLDALCLSLFHYNGDKKTFAKSIIDDRDSVIKYAETNRTKDLNAVLANRTKQINHLRDYAAALNIVIEPLSKTLYWVHGEFIKHKTDSLMSWQGSDPLQITFDEYSELLKILDNISPVINIALEQNIDHWQVITKQYFPPDFVDKVNRNLLDLRDTILSGAKISSHFEFREFTSIESIYKILEMREAINAIQPMQKSFIAGSEDLRMIINKLTAAINCFEQYNSLSNSFSNVYNIPFHWDSQFINVLDDHVNETATIVQVKHAAADSLKFKKRLDRIDKIIGIINATFSGDFDIDELLLLEAIFQVDPIIKNVKNWTSRRSLQFTSECLNELYISFNDKNKSINALANWGIIDIDQTAALPISNNFENKYKSFFRYLCPHYYKDRQTIISWCKSATPLKHEQYKEIAITVRNYCRFKNKFYDLLDKFNRSCIQQEFVIEPHQIFVLLNSVDIISKWFKTHHFENVPEKIIQLMQCPNTISLIQELCLLVRDTRGLLVSSWNIFKFDKKYSTKELINLYPSLQQSLDNKLYLYDVINSIHKVKMHDCLISELSNKALEIDGLFSRLNALQKLNLDHLFENKNIIEEVINDPDKLQIFLLNIKSLLSIATMDVHVLPRDITVKSALEYATALQRILPALQEWAHRYNRTLSELKHLFGNENITGNRESLVFTDYANIVDTMLNDKAGLEKWLTYKRYANQLEKRGYGWFLESIQDKFITNPASLFAQSLWSAWLEAYYNQNQILQNFIVKDHERIIDEFKKLEQLVLQTNTLRILELYAPSFDFKKRWGGESEKKLVHQSQLKIRHKAIRKVVQDAGSHIIAYKPCWMMSPLTLSSYVPYGSLHFDVVIFDEASQIRVEHTLGAIARAEQVLIFGDENQLPPTSFFIVSNDDNETTTEEEMVEDYESILHATKEILPGANHMLSYHYRSKYEDLIAFSNRHVYDDRLITFPSANKSHKAVLFEFVEEGVFDGGKGGSRKNDTEAQRVVELCIKTVTEQPNKSLGVISFSRTQEIAIRDALQSYLKKNPQFQYLLDETSDIQTPFFIKNLESVQGDERDIIIISIGYGRDKRTNTVYNRFGPINGPHGYRRLNVAVTRAKEQIICVSSIKSSDIGNTERSRGAYLLQKYLEYAEKGIASLDASLLVQNQDGILADSSFELEVEKALQQRGYTVHRQIGASGFKIDLAIVNPKNEHEYILGIECDGASYHSSYSARMNDRIRQDILERLDWKLYRIWSQHWISHKEDIIDDIIRKLSNS